jgi:hypothetical protein
MAEKTFISGLKVRYNALTAGVLCLAILVASMAAVPPARAADVTGTQLKNEEAEEPEGLVVDEPERKDAFVAGLLSWEWPGLGQFYTQNYAVGSLFLLVDIVQKSLLVYLLFYYSDKYTQQDEMVRWDNIENRDKAIMIGYVFSVLVVRVWCVLDAVFSADRYNREIYFPYWKYQNRNRFSFSVENEPRRINFAYTRSL